MSVWNRPFGISLSLAVLSPFAMASEQVDQAIALLTATSASHRSAIHCTAFLIAPDILMTNSHCIPEDLQESKSSCQKRIWAVFPDRDGLPMVRSECSTILAASPTEDPGRDTDYAFIILSEPSSRTPLQISREGFKDGDTYSAHLVESENHTYTMIKFHQESCRAVHETVVFPDSNHDKAPVMVLADCRVHHGNSGSPILDSEGKVRGIVQAYYVFVFI